MRSINPRISTGYGSKGSSKKDNDRRASATITNPAFSEQSGLSTEDYLTMQSQSGNVGPPIEFGEFTRPGRRGSKAHEHGLWTSEASKGDKTPLCSRFRLALLGVGLIAVIIAAVVVVLLGGSDDPTPVGASGTPSSAAQWSEQQVMGDPTWELCATGSAGYLSPEDLAEQIGNFPVTLALGTSYTLPSSGDEVMFSLIEIDTSTENCVTRPMVTSYGGLNWQVSSGSDPSVPQMLTCSAGSCTFTTPSSSRRRSAGLAYRIDAHVNSDKETNSIAAARLLYQSSFGATRTTITEVLNLANLEPSAKATSASIAAMTSSWLSFQMGLKPTFSREHARLRTNPRAMADSVAGTIREPCEDGSRWHEFTFTVMDRGKILVAKSNPDAAAWDLELDGLLRTQVAEWGGIAWTDTNGTWDQEPVLLCSVDEKVGGRIDTQSSINGVFEDCDKSKYPDNYYTKNVNPVISLLTVNGAYMQTFNADQIILKPVESSRTGIYIATSFLNDANCAAPFEKGVTLARVGNSTWLRFDARIKLLRNTIMEPVQGGDDETCPVVRQNFVNEAHCQLRSAGACGTQEYVEGTSVTLSDTFIRATYSISQGGTYLYRITNLKLSDTESFCTPGLFSRWVRITRSGGCPADSTTLDTDTSSMVQAALASVASTSVSPDIRDTVVMDHATNGQVCVASDSEAVNAIDGSVIEIDDECWQHSHEDEWSVWDFSEWVLVHPGNLMTLRYGERNPITKPAEQNNAFIVFPDSHPASRFTTAKKRLERIGEWNEVMDFTSLPRDLMSFELATYVGAATRSTSSQFEACGSRAESENDPVLGHYYVAEDFRLPQDFDGQANYRHQSQMLLDTVQLKAHDQLRQRVAWALAQTLVVSTVDFGLEEEVEAWAHYYDILMGRSFGSYTTILQEVTDSILMGRYLTYRNNEKASGNKSPDENYAREIMQLFSMGLYEMNHDGTYKFDANGNLIATYDNRQIQTNARVFTGYRQEQMRSNLATPERGNLVDPMDFLVTKHDKQPKMAPSGGYLGDGYPVCSDLPDRLFLKKGAEYQLAGFESTFGSAFDDITKNRPHFTPTPRSALYQALCSPAVKDGPCTFPQHVTLDESLECDGIECAAETIVNVKIVDPTDNTTMYYHYLSTSCVKMYLFNDGKVVRNQYVVQCADPTNRGITGVACCSNETKSEVVSYNGSECLFVAESMSFATAQARCAAMTPGGEVCERYYDDPRKGSSKAAFESCALYQSVWTTKPCALQIQVYPTGEIGVLDEHGDGWFNYLKANDPGRFYVRWEDWTMIPQYDTENEICSIPGCDVVKGNFHTCRCDIEVIEDAIFTSTSSIPTSLQDVRAALSIGAPSPSLYEGVYSICASCSRGRPGLRVWNRDGHINLHQSSIIEFIDAPADKLGHRFAKFWFNRQSKVYVGTSTQDRPHFRTPPVLSRSLGEEPIHPGSTSGSNNPYFSSYWFVDRHDRAEVGALVNNVAENRNTAPFICRALVQNLVTANPSPAYLQTVTTAFVNGEYNGKTYSGEYGDLAAAVAATLSEPEARKRILESDPAFGMIEEPHINVMRMLRGLEYVNTEGTELYMPEMSDKIGQAPFRQPSVFSWFPFDYVISDGPVAARGLVSPKSKLVTVPLEIGMINGYNSLIATGLTGCLHGFGKYTSNSLCEDSTPEFDRVRMEKSSGYLSFKPTKPGDPTATVDEISTILMAGRLLGKPRQMMIQEYTQFMSERNLDIHEDSVTTSSTPVYPVALAFDGITNNTADSTQCFRGRNKKTNEWMLIELDGNFSINSVVIRSPDCCGHWVQGYQVILSDGTVCAKDAFQLPQMVNRHQCPPNSDVSWVRIERPGYDKDPLSFCEIEVRELAISADGLYEPDEVQQKDALESTLTLMTSIPNYRVTNVGAPTNVPRPVVPETPGLNRTFENVLVVFLSGGMDSFSTIVPMSGCTQANSSGYSHPHDLYAEYAFVRENLAIPKEKLLPIDTTGQNQPCDEFGINSELKFVHDLFEAGELSFIANIGTLIKPTTREGYSNKEPGQRPSGVFAHNHMQRVAQTVDAVDKTAQGILGKMLTRLNQNAEPYRGSVYGFDGLKAILTGSPEPATIIDPTTGIVRYDAYDRMNAKLKPFMDNISTSIFDETVASTLQRSLESTEKLAELLNPITTESSKLQPCNTRHVCETACSGVWSSSKPTCTAPAECQNSKDSCEACPGDMRWMNDICVAGFPQFPDTKLGKQLKMYTRVLKMDNTQRPQGLGQERAGYVVVQGGYDTHHNTMEEKGLLPDLDASLEATVAELKAQGMWDSTTIVTISDFGRTMTSNGLGSDHAWGGNMMIAGGKINGGRIFGKYPDGLTVDTFNKMMDRGRLIPEFPWESIWLGVGQHFGLSNAELQRIMPQLKNFPEEVLLSEDQLYST